MKLVIFGASGASGRALVEQARERGHEVRAIVRPKTSWRPPPGVDLLEGDLYDVAFLTRAVEGRDVVLSALGLRFASIAPWAKPEVADFLSRCTPALVEAMKASGVARIIAISAGGVGDSWDQVPGMFRAFVKTTALRHAYAELEVMESCLKRSGLDFCICRPTGLTDGPRTGKAKVVTAVHGRATIARADVAAWMLDEAEHPAHGGRTPMITETGAD
jgi:putative NADH-flavin reductase